VVQGFANSVFLRGFLFPALPTIAGHCVRVRVILGSRGVRIWSPGPPQNGFLAALKLLLG
jgi:hypothetical protein